MLHLDGLLLLLRGLLGGKGHGGGPLRWTDGEDVVVVAVGGYLGHQVVDPGMGEQDGIREGNELIHGEVLLVGLMMGGILERNW